MKNITTLYANFKKKYNNYTRRQEGKGACPKSDSQGFIPGTYMVTEAYAIFKM